MYALSKAVKRIRHTIPVTQPVKRYLEKNFAADYELTQDQLLGMWLINAMVRKTVQVRTVGQNPHDAKFLKRNRFNSSWSFVTPRRYNDNFVIPARMVFRFNVMIRKFMQTELLLDMETLRRQGEVFYIQTAINNFRDRYGIWDTELNDAQLRKMYLRFRKKNETVSSEFSNFSPGMLLG